MKPLPEELEKEMPEQIQVFRRFYFNVWRSKGAAEGNEDPGSYDCFHKAEKGEAER